MPTVENHCSADTWNQKRGTRKGMKLMIAKGKNKMDEQEMGIICDLLDYYVNFCIRTRSKNKANEMTLTQISFDNGLIKLKNDSCCFNGFLIMIEMPWFMKGVEKSITRSRSDVIVSGAMAISASRRTNSPTIPSQPPTSFGFSLP